MKSLNFIEQLGGVLPTILHDKVTACLAHSVVVQLHERLHFVIFPLFYDGLYEALSDE